ncbi:HAD family hydrolase [Candidatus Woesearchaeota archaeon]|nr:HAD family hydrolase [Candidatus Woesearchaeota archaeon]
MQIKNIIFDWSGTLSDDFTCVYEASMLVFNKLGRKSISKEEYKREFVLLYMRFWNKYFPDLTKEKGDKLYLEAINQVKEPTIYPQVKEELEKLKSLGINMIIINSHPQEKLIKEAKNYKVQNLFKEINGSVADKTEIIHEILKRNKFNNTETVYVGDMTHDIDAGKKAEVTTIAIGWGYETKEKLMQAQPNYYIENITKLDKTLNLNKQ